MHRWTSFASVTVLAGACVACFLAGSSEWSARSAMIGNNSAEVVEQAWFAGELFAAGVINLLAAVAVVLLHRRSWSWWAVMAVQLVLFVVAVAEGTRTDIGWFYFAGLPVVTFGVLLALRKADTSRRRSNPGQFASPAAHTSR